MWRPDLRISVGFWLLLCWFGMANGWGLLLEILLAAGLHELGHCIVLMWYGTRPRGMRIGAFGAVLDTDTHSLTYGQELAAILAGPGTNLLCALLLLLFREEWTRMIGIHLSLGAFNMLPLRPLDGGRALFLVLSWLLGPGTAERISSAVGAVAGGCLGVGLCGLVWKTGGSLWLLPAAGALLLSAGREWHLKEEKI